MLTFRRCRTAVLIGVSCALVVACGATAKVKETNDLKMIGLAFHNYCSANANKAPTKADDLKPYLQDAPQVFQDLQSGKYVFIWGVSLQDMIKAGGASDKVLGYEKDVPTKGGPVLMGDASVRQMTADEFKAAKKAK